MKIPYAIALRFWDIHSPISEYTDKIETLLIQSLLKIAQESINNNKLEVEIMLKLLEGYSNLIFIRLAIRLVELHANESNDVVFKYLKRIDVIRDVRPEYRILLYKGFRYLSSIQQTEIIDLLSVWNENDHERYYWLSAISDNLPSKLKLHLNNLIPEFGDPEPIQYELPRYSRAFTVMSPVSAEELNQMKMDELINYLKAWQPSKTDFGDTMQHIGTELSKVISDNPQPFIENKKAFLELRIPFVYAWISGLEQATQKKENLDWKEVLDVCNSLIKQKYEIEVSNDIFWIRGKIADLIQNGLSENLIHENQRLGMSRIIKNLFFLSLSEDQIAHEKGISMSSYSTSLNTLIGKTSHVVMDYINWVNKHSDTNKATDRMFFNLVPEILETLNELVKTSMGTVKAVFAVNFNWLNYMDPRWVQDHYADIFSQDHEQLWNAAWSSYISYGRLYVKSFDLLETEYIKAVSLTNQIDDSHDSTIYIRNLAAHIAYLYLEKKIEISGTLLQKLYKNDSIETNVEILEVIGREKENHENERVKALWEWRLAIISEKPLEYRQELFAFIWLYKNPTLDDNWRIKQFEIALSLVKDIPKNSFWIRNAIAQLIKDAEIFPIEAVKILELILFPLNNPQWHMSVINDEIEEILSIIIKSGVQQAQRLAEDLIAKLAFRGYISFKRLV